MRPGCLWHTPTTEDADWLFVVGASFLAAVCTTNTTSTTATIGGHPLALSDPTRSVIESLWVRVDEPGVAIEEIVGTMPLGAEGGVRSFAIVTFGDQPAPDQTDRTVTAVVRGSAVVDVFSVGGSRRFSSGGVQPWMLADFRSVTAVTLGGGDQPTQPMAVLGRAALPFAGGVVRGQRMLWSLQPLTFASAEFSADADAGEAADRADATQVEGDARDAVDDASA
ncbi:MAG: hypothetical protein ABI310_03150, partial [Microbacteriaceae bacterium]